MRPRCRGPSGVLKMNWIYIVFSYFPFCQCVPDVMLCYCIASKLTFSMLCGTFFKMNLLCFCGCYSRRTTLAIGSLQNVIYKTRKLFSNVVRRITPFLPMRGLSGWLMTHSRGHAYIRPLICEKCREYVLVICLKDPSLSYNQEGCFSSMTLCCFMEVISGRAVSHEEKGDVRHISKYGILRVQSDR